MAPQVKKVKVRSFLAVKDKGGTAGAGNDPIKSMTLAFNRMGNTVEDIGRIITDTLEAKAQAARDAAEASRLQLVKKQEDEYEAKLNADPKDVKDGVEKNKPKVDKGKWSWLQKLLSPFTKLLKFAATWFVLDFLSNPKNKKIISVGFTVIGGWFKILSKVVLKSVDFIMSAFGEKNPVIGALKLIGGIAGLFLADRILKPWKLFGDANRLRKFVQGQMKRGLDPKKLAARQRLGKWRNIRRMRRLRAFGGNMARRGGGLLRGGGKVLAGGGLSVAMGVGAAFRRKDEGASVAIGAGAGAVMGGLAMSALLTPILGPFGPIVGQFIGSFLGEHIGAFIGDAIKPLFEPIKRVFGEILMPVMKSYYEGPMKAFSEFWQSLIPALEKVWDFLKPFADAAINRIQLWLQNPAIKNAVARLKRFVGAAGDMVGGIQSTAGKVANVFGLESELDTAQRELGDEQRTVRQKERAIEAAKEKLIWLQTMAQERGMDGKEAGWHRYTLGERIQFQREHIEALENARSDAVERVESEQAQLTELQAHQAESARMLEAAAAGHGTGSKIFPLKNGQFDGEPSSWFKSAPQADGKGDGMGVVLKPKPDTSLTQAVVAAVGGIVSGWNFKGGKDKNSQLKIEAEGEPARHHRYLHMEPLVKKGDKVKAGQMIGRLVDQGADTRLNFSVWKPNWSWPENPHKELPKLFGTPMSAENTIIPPEINNADTVATTTANVQGTNPSNGDIQTEGSTVIVQPIARRSNGGNGDSGSTVVGASAETNIRG